MTLTAVVTKTQRSKKHDGMMDVVVTVTRDTGKKSAVLEFVVKDMKELKEKVAARLARLVEREKIADDSVKWVGTEVGKVEV